MSQSAITLAFENYKAQEATNGQVLKLNEFVLANVPGLDPSLPVDRNETVPSDEYIVHRQAVSKEGVVNQNTVAYSITMGSDVGDFDFNWLGLRNKETGLLGMVVHVPTQKKIATAAGQQGNALTRSFLMEYDGAAEATGITTPAESWQIDFTARLFGIDDVQRLVNRDLYGAGAFFGDSFLVTKSGSVYSVTAGVGYIGGLRAELSQNQTVNANSLPTKIWADVSYQGTVTSDWQTVISLMPAETMVDYVDAAGFAHYVFAVAAIDSAGVVTDLRPKGSVPEQELHDAINELNDALAKHEKSRNHPDASLSEKGMVRLSNATDSNVEDVASTSKATKIAMDNANARLAKNRNGEDIPNKQLFVENIGAVPKTITINGKPLNNNIVLSSADTNSFPLSSSGTYPDVNAVPWNAPSGTYVAHDVGSTRLILHFNTNEGSCPAVQFLVDYRNGGISYRSARDQSGFEDLWTPLDCYPAGAPIPWPSDILPSDGKYIFMTGQAFDKAKYPRLAKAYPSGVLPDMRGQTIKGKPVSGRAVLSYEQDGNKSHTHAATASTADLGTRDTTGFDYGNKSTSASGDHQHAYTTFAREGGGSWGFYANAQNGGDKVTTPAGNHAHTVYIGAHAHQVYIGAHGHVISVAAEGNSETTVRNTAFNYMVRLA